MKDSLEEYAELSTTVAEIKKSSVVAVLGKKCAKKFVDEHHSSD